MENHSFDNYLGQLGRGDGLPDPPPENPRRSGPPVAAFHFEQIDIPRADGARQFAWVMPEPTASAEAPWVLFLHGNAENISTHFANVAWLPAAGFNVLALDYRGYGGSAGTPSLAGAQLDIDAAMRELLARRDVDPARIVVLGQSLGGALAIHYLAHSRYREHVCALVSDSAA